METEGILIVCVAVFLVAALGVCTRHYQIVAPIHADLLKVCLAAEHSPAECRALTKSTD